MGKDKVQKDIQSMFENLEGREKAVERDLQDTEILQALYEMSSGNDAFGLFDPHLWFDKTGDNKWHCELKGHCGTIFDASGTTIGAAVRGLYQKATKENKKYKSQFTFRNL